MTKLTNAARGAIPGLVRLIGTIPPGWRAAISTALLIVFALLAYLAVRHEQPDWLPIIGAAVVAVFQAAFGAAGEPPASPPKGGSAGPMMGAGLVLLVLLPGCAALQDAAKAADKARDAVERACQLAVDVEAHCLLLREQSGDDIPPEVDEMCGRASDAVRLCGGRRGEL